MELTSPPRAIGEMGEVEERGKVCSFRCEYKVNLADSCFKDRNEPSFIAETSFVRAPLNSRVDAHGGSGPSGSSRSKGKGKEREDSLANLSLEIQEALILEDLLYVLMVRIFTALMIVC
jgi:hypothetical protein